MRKLVLALVVGGAVGLAAYLSVTGVTLRDAWGWTERNLGLRIRAPDLKDVPSTGYVPVTPSR
jgi:hypothetical protein